MKVDLKGSVFVITGKLTRMDRRDSEAAIQKAGGSIAKSVTRSTSYVIVGDRPSSKYTKAKNMGIPCLSEQDFEALISGKSVEVEEVGAAGDRGVDELLGEVRSVMQGAPSVQMWSALVTLLDACRAEDVHVLTEYIDGYITRWTAEHMQGLAGSSLALADATKGPRYYYQRGVAGELRVAPEHWVGEMQQGVESPKFKVVRALELTSTKLTSTAIVKILTHPSLAHLHTLKLPQQTVPSKALVKALCEHATLTHLKLIKVDDRTVDAFTEYGTQPRQLTILDVSGFYPAFDMRDREDVFEFITTPFFSTVTSLHLSGRREYDRTFFEHMAEHDAMPQVEDVHFEEAHSVVPLIVDMLNSSWAATHLKRLTTHRLFRQTRKADDLTRIFTTDFEGHLDVLDLGGFTVDLTAKQVDKGIAKLFNEVMPTSRLLEHVDTLVLGKWKTDELADKLARNFPSLTVQ